MKRIIYCIYHSIDLDGWMSAAIIKRAHPNAIFIGWNYGDKFPHIQNNAIVYMVDISFPPKVMQELLERYIDIVWIDHHISAINANRGFIDKMEGIQDTTMAACELTWNYMFPKEQMPELVRLLGRYDCFGHKGTVEEGLVLEFQYGARAFIRDVDSAYYYLTEYLTENDSHYPFSVIEKIHLAGQSIYKYLTMEAQSIYKNRFEVTLGGYRFACVDTCIKPEKVYVFRREDGKGVLLISEK